MREIPMTAETPCRLRKLRQMSPTNSNSAQTVMSCPQEIENLYVSPDSPMTPNGSSTSGKAKTPSSPAVDTRTQAMDPLLMSRTGPTMELQVPTTTKTGPPTTPTLPETLRSLTPTAIRRARPTATPMAPAPTATPAAAPTRTAAPTPVRPPAATP